MTDRKIELTRRRVLTGLTTAGLASAGAGLGTSAYLSDEESFTDNTIQAGALNMTVSGYVKDYSTEMPPLQFTSSGSQHTADGNEVTITAENMLPGDWFLLEWKVDVIGNPAYVQITSVDDDYSNDEGQNPEAETDTSGSGDLGSNLLATIWHEFSTFGGGDVRQYLGDLDKATEMNNGTLSDYEEPDVDGVTSPTGVEYTTLDEAHNVYQNGVALTDPNTGDLVEVAAGDSVSFHQLFEIPTGVGNDIQGDSVTFTLRFGAEQTRHNDTPFNSSQ